MTQTRTITAFIAVVAAFGALAALLLPGQPAPAQAAATTVAADFHRIDITPATDAPVVDELVARTLGGHVGETARYTTVQAQLVHKAADHVCLAMTAGVALVDLEPVLTRMYGLTGTEAHQFVIDAHATQCPLA